MRFYPRPMERRVDVSTPDDLLLMQSAVIPALGTYLPAAVVVLVLSYICIHIYIYIYCLPVLFFPLLKRLCLVLRV